MESDCTRDGLRAAVISRRKKVHWTNAELKPLSTRKSISNSGSNRTAITRLKVDQIRVSELSQFLQQKVTLDGSLPRNSDTKPLPENFTPVVRPASVKMENKLVHQFSSWKHLQAKKEVWTAFKHYLSDSGHHENRSEGKKLLSSFSLLLLLQF